MNKKQSSLIFQLVLLYGALTIILALGFGIDIAGWWARPVYRGIATVIHALIGLFN
jgi:hypothetical protein